MKNRLERKDCDSLLGGRRLAMPQPFRLVRHKALEPGADVWLTNVNVVFFCDSGRAVPHQFGERVSIHATLGAARAERVTPAFCLQLRKAHK